MRSLNINLQGINRATWLKRIVDIVNCGHFPYDDVNFSFENFPTGSIEPFHVVTLACFLEHLDKKRNCRLSMDYGVEDAGDFFLNVIKLPDYWLGKSNYSESPEKNLLNLWRVVEGGIEAHSEAVHNFLRRGTLKHKDLSAVKNSLIEAYQNIIDHAEAEGNAFSCTYFDKDKSVLHVAVCDLGVGIAHNIRTHYLDIPSDEQALRRAMEERFSTHSKTHNAGMGLAAIRNTCTENDKLRIVNGNWLLVADRSEIKTYPMSFDFPGTLLYYDVSLSHFDDEDILLNFEFE